MLKFFLNHSFLRTALPGSKLPPPPVPALSKQRLAYLRTLSVQTKVTALHILKVIINLTLSVLMKCSPFSFPIGLGQPFSYIPNGAELRKKDPKLAETLQKPCTFTRGLRKPRKEELSDPFGLPGILEDGEFNEAWDVIMVLQ